MMLDKNEIRRSFSLAAGTYDANSPVQREVAGEVARSLASAISTGLRLQRTSGSGFAEDAGEAYKPLVLDIGCGTGTLASHLRFELPGARLAGCDISLSMTGRSLSKGHYESGLAAADCEALPYKDESFDAAASSLTFQWAPDPGMAFREACRVLAPGGLFVFSTLGPGTLKELRKSYSRALGGRATGSAVFAPYTSCAEAGRSLGEAGLQVLEIRTVELIKEYGGLFDLLARLKNIGALRRARPAGSSLAPGTLLKEASRIYEESFPSESGGIRATYEVIYATARKA